MGEVDGIPLNCNQANSNLDRKQNVGTQLTCNESHLMRTIMSCQPDPIFADRDAGIPHICHEPHELFV